MNTHLELITACVSKIKEDDNELEKITEIE